MSRVLVRKPVDIDESASGGGGGVAPSFGDDPADTLIFEDDFEWYNCISTASCDQAIGDNYSTNEPAFTTWAQLSTGRGGSGQAIELPYGKDQAGELLMSRKNLGTSYDHFFFSVWMKTTPGWAPDKDISDGILKGFIFNHEGGGASGSRHQFGISDQALDGNDWDEVKYGGFGREAEGGSNEDSYVWQGRLADDEGVPFGGRAGTAFPNGINDGNWHHWVFEIKADGSGNEYIKSWLDDTLVWDDEGKGRTYPRVQEAKWFGNFTEQAGQPNGSVFIDDVTCWQRV